MATELTINPETVCEMILRARAVNVKEIADIDEDGSNWIDDPAHAPLAESADDSGRLELAGVIRGLNEREAAELVAITWIGRGDFEPEEFMDVVAAARERNTGGTEPSIVRYLLGIPLLGDYLNEGLNALGHSCLDGEETSVTKL